MNGWMEQSHILWFILISQSLMENNVTNDLEIKIIAQYKLKYISTRHRVLQII